MNPTTVKRYLPWVVAMALFMEQLDSTIVNTAIPAMAAGLRVTPLSLKAVVTSYILSLAVCIPVSGWMADRFGTRRVFGIAVAVFTGSSILCGLAVNVPMLVVARILQGLGAAMMMPVGRLAIIRAFPKAELLRAMNFVIIPALIGPLLGPTVGGLIVHWMSWRDIFWVNVPVGLVALGLIHRHMPDYRGDAPRSRGCWKSSAITISTRHQRVLCCCSPSVYWLLTAGMRAKRLIRCFASRYFGSARFTSRSSVASSPGWAWAGCRFCCPCSTNWVWVCLLGSRDC